MRADPAAYARHRIGIACVVVGFFEMSIGDQGHVAARIGAGRTSHHAREIGVQPLPIDPFVLKAPQHVGLLACGCSVPTRLHSHRST